MALKGQKPPEHYGMGFALSNVGDGNLTTAMLQSWGGRIADDAGKHLHARQPGDARLPDLDRRPV